MFPWNEPIFKGWSIVGMNHYHVNGTRHLFVAMAKDGRLVKAESVDENEVFYDLKVEIHKINDPNIR